MASERKDVFVREVGGVDWRRKLTSRKFWLSVASFVSMLIVFFGGSEEVATQVTALIMAGASIVGYVIGEGLADCAGGFDAGVCAAGGGMVAESLDYEDHE